MKFPYVKYISQFPGTDDFRMILRPVVTIGIAGPSAEIRWDALLDTGADETVLPLSLAKVLGIELDENETSQVAGISGDELTVYYGEVVLQLHSDDEQISWRTMVGFVEFGASKDELIILGHDGCLDYFTAIFDGERAEFELIPNSLLPAR